MREFHKGSLRTLIVSDVAARGIDVPDCDTVFNLELPSGPAHYAHRAGRTGRMGAPGRVVSIITQSERFVVDKMRDKLGTVIVVRAAAASCTLLCIACKKHRKCMFNCLLMHTPAPVAWPPPEWPC